MHWEAELSNGDVFDEGNFYGEKSQWQMLMDFCWAEGTHIKKLSLVDGGDEWEAKPDADGYWYARSALLHMSIPARDQEGHGIGWVSEGVLFIMWVVKMNGSWVVRTEKRLPEGQKQIIWSNVSE